MSMRLSRSIVGEAEAEAVRRVIVEDGYLGMGHETCLFEQELAAYLGVAPEQVVTTNTGTAALTLAVDAIAPRDAARKPQILVPSLTFVASFQAIEAAGCEPVACDVLAETGTIDLKDAARRCGGPCAGGAAAGQLCVAKPPRRARKSPRQGQRQRGGPRRPPGCAGAPGLSAKKRHDRGRARHRHPRLYAECAL